MDGNMLRNWQVCLLITYTCLLLLFVVLVASAVRQYCETSTCSMFIRGETSRERGIYRKDLVTPTGEKDVRFYFVGTTALCARTSLGSSPNELSERN